MGLVGGVPLWLSHRPKPVIDWTLKGSMPSSMTYTNASGNRSYFDASGVMKFAAINVPRFDYAPVTSKAIGLLVEEQRTNVVPLSVLNNAFAGFSPQAVSADYLQNITAPDGVGIAVGLGDSFDSGIHYLGAGNTSFEVGKTYSASVFAKKKTASILQLTLPMLVFGGSCYANFNLQTGSIVQVGAGCTARIKAIGNDVYLCSITSTAIASLSALSLILGFTNGVEISGRLPSYTGTNKVINVWGMQTEIGPNVTSYIPTDGTTVTRAADQLSYTIPVGVSRQRLIFDDASYQDMAVSAGAYTLNASTLNRTHIKNIQLWRV